MKFKRLSILTLFGFAMGWMESVVVVYIREILLFRGDQFTKAVTDELMRPLMVTSIPGYSIMWVERTREISTIVMLVCIALLIEKKWLRRFAAFLWAFAVWDLVYYLGLKIMIGWPPSLDTTDCLFLIPSVWLAPVWVPLAVMAVFLAVSGLILYKVKDYSL